LKITSAQAPL
jgi:hypothetical protein